MNRKLLIGGVFEDREEVAEVRSPWDQRVVSTVALASEVDAERALAFAVAHRDRVRRQTTGQRRAVLQGIAEGLAKREQALSDAICDEAGKPMRSVRVEVKRAIETFRLAAAEVTRFAGQVVPIDLDAGSAPYDCVTRRFPAGVVVGIVPFNFPLNLGAHKVAPALAVGAPIIVKPPPQAPSAQLLLGEIALEAGADPAALQVLPCDNAVAERLATDPRVRILSFTGSAKVGWMLKAKAAGKVVLELGGNAAVVVADDAELPWAAERCAVGGMSYAGQVCIRVQRIYVDPKVEERFTELLLQEVAKLKSGDPRDEAMVAGPVIDDAAAARIEAWIAEATAQGARVLAGGRRQGRMIEPTVLAGVPTHLKVHRQEVFGPVLVISRAKSFEEAIAAVNDSAYGLQAGVFTHDVRRIHHAFHGLEVGGVIVNDYPTFRSDAYPYGGVKGSGLGREGVRASMEELTEERVLVTRH